MSTAIGYEAQVDLQHQQQQHQRQEKPNETHVVEEDDESAIVKNSKAVSSWTIFASALANFSDGYQNNMVWFVFYRRHSLTQQLIPHKASSTNVIFKHYDKAAYTSAVQTRISNSLLVGAVIGIVVFGYFCDVFTRKGGLWITSGLVVIGSILATLTFQVQPQGTHDMFWYLTIARGIAGVGVGGEYPSSAAAALESSNEVGISRNVDKTSS